MRLACLSHAASVQAEPGSNSSIKFLGLFPSSCLLYPANLKFEISNLRSTGEEVLRFLERGYPRNEFVQPSPTADLTQRMKMGVTALAAG